MDAVIGELVRRKRRGLGMNQQDLGDYFGINQSSVAKWERGARPAARHLPKIAKFLEVPLEEMLSLYHDAPEASVSDDIEHIKLIVESMDRRLSELTHLVQSLATPPEPAALRTREASGRTDGSEPRRQRRVARIVR